MKHKSPIAARINLEPYNYVMELDTDQAGSIIFTPEESAVRGDWPPMIAAPSVELIAALYYFRKMAEARARILERAKVQGREVELENDSRGMQAIVNDGTLTVTATVEGYLLMLRADVESIIGAVPVSFGFYVSEISDILSYLAAVDETQRVMDDLDSNTSKLLAIVSEEQEGRRA